MGDKDKNLSVREHLDMVDLILAYLRDIINYHKTKGECKIHLTIAIEFISSKDFKETQIMHSKSDNIAIIMGSETNEIIE